MIQLKKTATHRRASVVQPLAVREDPIADPGSLERFDIFSARALGTLAFRKFHGVAFAEVFEGAVDCGAVEEDVVSAGCDEAEALF